MSQLRFWREQRGLSQRQLGDAIGVSDNAISQFERGRIKPRLHHCMALAQALGIDAGILTQEFYGMSLHLDAAPRLAHGANSR